HAELPAERADEEGLARAQRSREHDEIARLEPRSERGGELPRGSTVREIDDQLHRDAPRPGTVATLSGRAPPCKTRRAPRTPRAPPRRLVRLGGPHDRLRPPSRTWPRSFQPDLADRRGSSSPASCRLVCSWS